MDKATELLSKNIMLTIDMLEPIRRGSAKILFLSHRGILILEKISKAYMMYARDKETAENIINLIPKDASLIVGHKLLDYKLLKERFSFSEEMICFNVVYRKGNLLNENTNEVKIELLSRNYIKEVSKIYSKSDVVEDDYIKDRIVKKAMYGAFIKNELCGFIGYHKEGSIGMLEVLPQYRGRGIGLQLQVKATNERLKSGGYAYGQVIDGNIPSLELQKKIGYEISKDKVYWLIK